jgi:thioredoxin 1
MSASITEVRDDGFEQQVLQQVKPVIVDFWAPWCGPCKAMAPAFEALADAYADKMIFSKCNVDESQATANRYGIKSIPTLMIFYQGQPIHSVTGMVSQSVLEDAIQKALAGETAPAPFIVN